MIKSSVEIIVPFISNGNSGSKYYWVFSEGLQTYDRELNFLTFLMPVLPPILFMSIGAASLWWWNWTKRAHWRSANVRIMQILMSQLFHPHQISWQNWTLPLPKLCWKFSIEVVEWLISEDISSPTIIPSRSFFPNKAFPTQFFHICQKNNNLRNYFPRYKWLETTFAIRDKWFFPEHRSLCSLPYGVKLWHLITENYWW